LGPRLGRAGWGQARPPSQPAQEGRGEEGCGWAALGSRPKREGGFLSIFHFLFSYNLLLSAFFMETKQILTRKRCVVQHDATTKENNSRFRLHKISS
jgi:hypothetical protein